MQTLAYLLSFLSIPYIFKCYYLRTCNLRPFHSS